jgi:hypothetical protein
MYYFIIPCLHMTGLHYTMKLLLMDAAVDRLNAVVAQAINLAVPSDCVTKHKCHIWFSGTLRSDVKKKNYFYRCYRKYKIDCFCDRFPFYRKLVKRTIKSDRFRWLKSVDENLKFHPQQFWMYV